MKTRAKPLTKAVSETEISSDPKLKLGPEASNPPQLFILPDDFSTEARIVSLTNPRYFSQTRYAICPARGIFEFTKVAPPKTTPRSWLLSNYEIDQSDKNKSNGYVTRTADLLITTSIDPLFFLLDPLAPSTKGSEPPKRHFLSSDDYVERLKDGSTQFSVFLAPGPFRTILEQRMAAVCDTVEAGDETMYRLSEKKLLEELLNKARKMVQRGLPASMEEKFVRKPLDVPMLSIKREDNFIHVLAKEEELRSDAVADSDTQTTTSATDSPSLSFSEASTAATSFSEEASDAQKPEVVFQPIKAPEGVAELLRLRTAFLFICSSYLAPHLGEGLKKTLASSASPVDFSSLDKQLVYLHELRQEALAARSLGDYSRKRAIDEDDETIELRVEKKRKKDEEEKRRRAGVSQGVKKLQKVNVSGMKKMSDFFKKK